MKVGWKDTSTRRKALAALGAAAIGTVTNGRVSLPRVSRRGTFSLAVLPDTQQYARLDNGIFEQQTRWIAEHRDAYSIRAVLHLGDLVHNPDDPSEWEVATAALETLETNDIPTLVTLGNHDATTIRDPVEFRRYVPTTRYSNLVRTNESVLNYGTFDGAPENAYFRQSIDGKEILYLTLEFGPRRAVIDWADDVLSTYEDATTFLVTHSYMYFDDTRTDANDTHNPRQYGLDDVHNGEELWTKLVRKHGNIVNVHSGHHIPKNTGDRTDRNDDGTETSQMFVNYQSEEKGGTGWLRLLTVDPADRVLSVRTYSPFLDSWSTSDSERFVVAADTS